ncbi:MAG: hypothetical protein R2744_03925 [Bacteroidales bacterium]
MPYLLRAAAVAILVTLSSLWTWEHILSPDANKMTLSEVSPEYSEVEQYYVTQVNYMEDEIKALPVGDDPTQKEMLLVNKYITLVHGIQVDLNTHPMTKDINAMIGI